MMITNWNVSSVMRRDILIVKRRSSHQRICMVKDFRRGCKDSEIRRKNIRIRIHIQIKLLTSISKMKRVIHILKRDIPEKLTNTMKMTFRFTLRNLKNKPEKTQRNIQLHPLLPVNWMKKITIMEEIQKIKMITKKGEANIIGNNKLKIETEKQIKKEKDQN